MISFSFYRETNFIFRLKCLSLNSLPFGLPTIFNLYFFLSNFISERFENNFS